MSRRVQVDEAGTMSCPACGCILLDIRSGPHHRAFFAYIAWSFKHWPENFDNWPERYDEFSPHNPEHLRAWLLYMSGFIQPPRTYRARNRAELAVQIEIMKADKALDALEGRYSWINPLKNAMGFEIISPASIQWEKIGEAKFLDLSAKVSAIVKDIVGYTFDEWKQSAR